MSDVINPNPIGQIASGSLIGLLITIILFYFFGDSRFIFDTLIILWGIIVLLSVYAFVVTRFITLEVSNKEVVYKKGIISLQSVHIPFGKITGLFMRQSLIERIFGLGTLEIDTAGGPFPEISINAMPYAALTRIVKKIEDETNIGKGSDSDDKVNIPSKKQNAKPGNTMYR